MRLSLSFILACVAVWSLSEIHGIPLSPNSAIWHKITKREAASPTSDNNHNKASPSSGKETAKGTATQDKTAARNQQQLIEASPDEKASGVEQSSFEGNEGDANSDRSIDWDLLSGDPADLEKELESRRRRRSVRSASLNRQHRIRTTNGRSRTKRDTYYEPVSQADLLAAYQYLQSRRQLDQEVPEDSSEIEASDADLANLASLIYELQNQDEDQDEESPIMDDEDQVLEPTNQYAELEISPQALATLEEVLSEQQDDDYPKDKRAAIDDQGDDEDEDEPVTAYLIPAAMEPSTGYVQIPLEDYANPYNAYQVDDDQDAYDEDLRRFDEEQLRERIQNLVDEINQQRRIDRRRR